MEESKNMLTGECRYCGQTQNVEAESKDDADRKATELCGCSQAIEERNYLKFCEKIGNLVTAPREETGFTPLQDNEYKLICVMADQMVRGPVTGAVIKLPDRKLTLSINDKNEPKFKQTKTVECGIDG